MTVTKNEQFFFISFPLITCWCHEHDFGWSSFLISLYFNSLKIFSFSFCLAFALLPLMLRVQLVVCYLIRCCFKWPWVKFVRLLSWVELSLVELSQLFCSFWWFLRFVNWIWKKRDFKTRFTCPSACLSWHDLSLVCTLCFVLWCCFYDDDDPVCDSVAISVIK